MGLLDFYHREAASWVRLCFGTRRRRDTAAKAIARNAKIAPAPSCLDGLPM
jgi:hypothetical protein